jgi:hypothetical protein
MSLLRRANDQGTSEWEPIPIGVWRFHISPAPEVKYNERFGNYGARFPLLLVPDEQQRLIEEHGRPPEGKQQSSRVSYTTGLSLGYVQRDGQYKSTKLIDFLEACLGSANAKRFRDWILAGGGPQKPADADNPEEELKLIEQWLGWFEGMEVYGSVRHEEDSAGVIWARFGGPMAVGSLPGQREDEYQAVGRGKLRSMIAEYEASMGASKSSPARVADDRRANAGVARERPTTTRGVVDAGDRTPSRRRSYEEIFPDDDKNKDDIPF